VQLKQIRPAHALALGLCLVAVMLTSCAPTGAPSVTTSVPLSPPANQAPEATTVATGCSIGGTGVFTPEDVRCYLANDDSAQVQVIDTETVVLLADPQSIADWAGAAIIYHIPTLSMLAMDRFGDIDPEASIFSSRAGMAALNELANDPELMAGLKQQMQLKWQTTPSNEPEIRLSTAWQDGPTTIFLIAVAGLEATDDRFYCPSETWTIGDNTVEIVADCMAHESGTPVSHFFFAPQSIKGGGEQPVQVALNGVPSNVVQVREGAVSQETAVYQAALRHITNRPLIVRGETASGFDDPTSQLATTVAPGTLQNYLESNEAPFSLLFLFHGSNAHFVHPSATIARDYLLSSDPQAACVQFRSDYPGLGGVVTLSRIGYSDDGTQALVHVLHECGPGDRRATYLTLARRGAAWQVTEETTAATALPTLTPEMDYAGKANGCGDIFVYRSNHARSEYVKVWIDARVFDLSTGPTTLDLAAHPGETGAWIDVYADSVVKLLGDQPYCNDVGPTGEPQSVWKAVSGTVTVTASASAHAEPCTGEPYQATVLLEDALFALGEETVYLPSVEFDDVTVGWCPG